MEAVWDTEQGAPLLLFAVPDQQQKTNHLAIGVPNGASLILTHKLDGEIKGLNSFADHPPVAPLFYGFRIMVGVGMLMLLVSWWGVWKLRKLKGQADLLPRYFLYLLAGMTFSGWIAVLAGWYVTEIGRQPFLVWGLVRTADMVTSTPASNIALTLGLYAVLYTVLMVAYVTVLKYMAEHHVETSNDEPRTSGAAIAAVADQGTDALIESTVKPVSKGDQS